MHPSRTACLPPPPPVPQGLRVPLGLSEARTGPLLSGPPEVVGARDVEAVLLTVVVVLRTDRGCPRHLHLHLPRGCLHRLSLHLRCRRLSAHGSRGRWELTPDRALLGPIGGRQLRLSRVGGCCGPTLTCRGTGGIGPGGSGGCHWPPPAVVLGRKRTWLALFLLSGDASTGDDT